MRMCARACSCVCTRLARGPRVGGVGPKVGADTRVLAAAAFAMLPSGCQLQLLLRQWALNGTCRMGNPCAPPSHDGAHVVLARTPTRHWRVTEPPATRHLRSRMRPSATQWGPAGRVNLPAQVGRMRSAAAPRSWLIGLRSAAYSCARYPRLRCGRCWRAIELSSPDRAEFNIPTHTSSTHTHMAGHRLCSWISCNSKAKAGVDSTALDLQRGS